MGNIKLAEIMRHISLIIGHMFTWKALKYRLFTVSWTMAACLYWTGSWFESVEVTATIVVGKFLYYGINEWYHHHFLAETIICPECEHEW